MEWIYFENIREKRKKVKKVKRGDGDLGGPGINPLHPLHPDPSLCKSESQYRRGMSEGRWVGWIHSGDPLHGRRFMGGRGRLKWRRRSRVARKLHGASAVHMPRICCASAACPLCVRCTSAVHLLCMCRVPVVRLPCEPVRAPTPLNYVKDAPLRRRRGVFLAPPSTSRSLVNVAPPTRGGQPDTAPCLRRNRTAVGRTACSGIASLP
jgi:hypothetical protein